MKYVLLCLTISLVLVGCEKVMPLTTPEFELRDFVVVEEKTNATEYSKAWNSYKGTGTLIARNVSSDRNLLVYLETHDNSMGTNSEPQYTTVLFRGGVGKVEVSKSKYGEISARPDYQWSVLGWQELNKAKIRSVESTGR